MPKGSSTLAPKHVPKVDGNDRAVLVALLQRLLPCEWISFAVAGVQEEQVDSWPGTLWRRQETSAKPSQRNLLAGVSAALPGAAGRSEPVSLVAQDPFGRLLVLPVQTGPPELATWVLTRSGEEFGRAELDLARLIGPVLRRHWHLTRLRRDGVTSREIEVLSLVAAGLTAAAVGRRCGISTRTVHKHLEHAYTKLGCHDRLSAVLLLRDAGLLA